MDPNTGLWDDEQLVPEVFWEEDVQHILATSTNPGREDTLAWHFDRRGLFTVKSAYHVLDDDIERLQTRQRVQSSSDSSSMDQQVPSGANCGNYGGVLPRRSISCSVWLKIACI
jgi:hypothetical protein